MTGVGAVMLLQNMIANRIYERPNTLGVQYFAFAQRQIKPRKSFLANVLNRLWRAQPRSQFYLNKSGKVRAKMILRVRISRPQTLKIGFVKGVELQELTPATREWQTV
jgi:hypothetical protein